MPIKRRKISELEEAKDLTGFFTIGYRVLNGVKKSVKYGLEHIQTAYENMLKAMDEAKEATTDMRLLEATVQENEEDRETAESRRDASEQGRCNEEEKRVEAENIRKIAESKRVDAESGRVTEEDARHNSELVRINAESLRVSQENTRKVAETNRVNVEATRVAEEGKRVIAEKGRVDAEAIRVAEFTTLKQNVETATSDANEMANHSTYIGTDHYVYKWNKSTKTYDKMDIYCKGDAFSIKRVYSSIVALQADVNNMEVEIGDFVLVNTNNVEDPDNAKLYVKNKKVDGTYSYDFLVDMSGAIGFTGKTPQISIGTVSKGSNPVVTLSEDGVDGDGNPKYKLNLVLPQGEKGEAPVLEVGTVTTGTSGSQASAILEPNGSTSTGAPKYRLNMAIPQGPQGTGNMQVSVSGLVSGKTYLFKPSANNSAVGTLVEFSQAQADWDVTDTSLPSFIKNKPSSFTPSAHKHKKSEITDFPTSMPASDVYDWAKQQNKPSYSALEVGALPKDGTAVAATKLQTARKINGVDFDGTKNIAITTVANCGTSDYSKIVYFQDTRGSNPDPSTYSPGLQTEFKNAEDVGLTNNNVDGFQGLITFRKYGSGSDWSGGAMMQLSDGSKRGTPMVRYGDANGWGNWKQFALQGDSIPYSNISNMITHSNEFNVLDEGYIDGSYAAFWFNYRWKNEANTPIPAINFGNGSGTTNMAILQCSRVNAPNGFFKESDKRIKSNIEELQFTLEDISKIPTVSFDMHGKRQIGTIAQDVESICPLIVDETYMPLASLPKDESWEVRKEGKIEAAKVKIVEYEMFGVISLHGVKLLVKKNAKLEQKVSSLEKEVKELKEIVKRLINH